MTTLFAHQQEFLAKNPAKSALVWSCGTGKTRTAIEWSNNDSVLIICPKALVANWKREIVRWRKKQLFNVRVVSKETFRREADNLAHFSQVIVDEVHNGFLTPQFKSQMSKALRGYLRRQDIKRVLLLSATVYSSSAWNIYSLAYLIGIRWNWQEFNLAFFTQVRMGPRMIPVQKKGAEERLAKIVKKIASVVDINECMDVPLQFHAEPEYFALTIHQERGIEKNYDPVPVVRYTMQHEIENGILLANEFRKAQRYECDKNARILDLCEENPKIAIVCRYNDQIDMLAELLAAYNPLIIRGSTKDRDAVTLQAESSEKCVVLIQADCAEGYQLPSFPLCVFASMSYSYVKFEQICGRFLRMDKPSKTTFLYLITEGDSVDQGVYDSVKKKEDFKIALFKK